MAALKLGGLAMLLRRLFMKRGFPEMRRCDVGAVRIVSQLLRHSRLFVSVRLALPGPPLPFPGMLPNK